MQHKKFLVLTLFAFTTVMAQAQTDQIQIMLADGQVYQPGATPETSDHTTGSLKVVPYGEGFITATSKGELIGHNAAVPFNGPNYRYSVMVDFVMNPNQTGGYFVTSFGNVITVGNAPFHGSTFVGSPFSPVGPVRSIEIAVDNTGKSVGYYLLTNTGTIVGLGNVPQLNGAPVRDAIKLKIHPNGTGYTVLTSAGTLHAFGLAPGLEEAVDLGRNNKIVDFTFTPDGSGYYLLDQWGYIHAAGNATPIENQVPFDQPIAVSLNMGVTAGSIENLPEDLLPVPTATATEVPTEEPTQEPTEVPTEVPTEEPTQVPTEIPTEEPEPTAVVDPTATPETPEPTNTPEVIPTEEPVESSPTPTPAEGETPTSTPTMPLPTETPEPTSTPEADPTATPTVTPTPESGIVEPGIHSLFLGTHTAQVINNQTGAVSNLTLRIAVEGNQVVVEDVNGQLFNTQKLVMELPEPLTLSHNNLTGNIESLNLSLTPETGIIMGTYLKAGSGQIPIPENYPFSIELFNQ